MPELPYEREAMRGEPTPSVLVPEKAELYELLKWIYAQYYAGKLTREQGAEIKKGLNLAHKAIEARDKVLRDSAKFWQRNEEALHRYVFDSTIENADKLIGVVYGMGG